MFVDGRISRLPKIVKGSVGFSAPPPSPSSRRLRGQVGRTNHLTWLAFKVSLPPATPFTRPDFSQLLRASNCVLSRTFSPALYTRNIFCPNTVADTHLASAHNSFDGKRFLLQLSDTTFLELSFFFFLSDVYLAFSRKLFQRNFFWFSLFLCLTLLLFFLPDQKA